MDVSLLLIPAAALAASLVTLISGFGLGTLLLPVFALFFPLELAILLTAVVHLLNNLFKLSLLWKDIHWRTTLLFGVPGILGAFLGATLMLLLGSGEPLYNGILHPVDPLDLAIAALMLLFALFELSGTLNALHLPPNWLVPGGLVSGFFGGLSGHQGALRSLFLLRSGLAKEAYIASGVAIACLVDLTRLPAYLRSADMAALEEQRLLLVMAVIAAFMGAWQGSRLMPKVTMQGVRIVVAVLLVVIVFLLTAGML